MESESVYLQRVAEYREQYRSRRVAELDEESARRRANNEVFIAGCWVPRTEAENIVRGMQQHDVVVFTELVVVLFLSVAAAAGLWRLFQFLFLP